MDVLSFSNPLKLDLNAWYNMQQNGTEIAAIIGHWQYVTSAF
jgi:hypothetical protein